MAEHEKTDKAPRPTGGEPDETAKPKAAPKPKARGKAADGRGGEDKAPQAAGNGEAAGAEEASGAPQKPGEGRQDGERGEQQAEARGRGRARAQRSVPYGIAHVTATFNNTVVTITDMKGAAVGWCSAGRAGFKGARKSTAFAATLVAQDAARQVLGRGMREVEVRVQGPGAGRESAIRALQAAGLNISVIKDVTPMPHNGCRPPKRRRV
ncbi:MAG: 30S ribosomal protein S11 [Kiritimatiellae bacterium]|nr:30S ribosomal protein S11 [Kiritimatiellia bacterium]